MAARIARMLDAEHVELDGMWWQRGWQPTPAGEFVELWSLWQRWPSYGDRLRDALAEDGRAIRLTSPKEVRRWVSELERS